MLAPLWRCARSLIWSDISLRAVGCLEMSAMMMRGVGYALWAEATEAIQKHGTMVKAPSGYPIQSPYVSIANRQAEIMMRIASEFGFTPASRSRISMPKPDHPDLFADSRSISAVKSGH